MPTLKEIRTRIASVTSTRQTTSAMKMVSAAKLHKAQDRITRLRPYALKMQEIISHVAADLAQTPHPYTEEREINHVLIVAIASNKGLCGALNHNTIRQAFALAETDYPNLLAQGDVHFMVFGEKGKNILKKKNTVPIEETPEMHDQFDSSFTDGIANQLMQAYTAGKYDRIFLVYHTFKNAATQYLTTECFLPIGSLSQDKNQTSTTGSSDYIFEPDRQNIVTELMPSMLRLQCFKAFCEASASEHGIRMTAMHQATDNADTLIGELTLQYNKARQAAITNQLVEIVSSTEAQQ